MRKNAFTLTEILVVIAIIVILAGILVGGLGFAGRRADEAKARATITEFSAGLDKFRSEKGYYPPCIDTANVKFTISGDKVELKLANDYDFYDKKGSKKPYMEGIEAGELLDPWGNAFKYKCPGTHNTASFDLWSIGADGVPGNEDDIVNWGTAQ